MFFFISKQLNHKKERRTLRILHPFEIVIIWIYLPYNSFSYKICLDTRQYDAKKRKENVCGKEKLKCDRKFTERKRYQFCTHTSYVRWLCTVITTERHSEIIIFFFLIQFSWMICSRNKWFAIATAWDNNKCNQRPQTQMSPTEFGLLQNSEIPINKLVQLFTKWLTSVKEILTLVNADTSWTL